MKLVSWFRLLFVLYCIEAGLVLLVLPWSGGWDRIFLQLLNVPGLSLVFHPLTRAAASGFGLMHLVWAIHDLDLWLAKRSPSTPLPNKLSR